MSIKSLLMPTISRHLLSEERLLHQRARAERTRLRRGERHRVHYFHQVDDPYSALTAGALPRLLERYQIELVPHLVCQPADDAAPERERLVAYSRRDAQLLAMRHGLPYRDPGSQPSSQAIERTGSLLVAAIENQRFNELAGPISARLWEGRLAAGDSALPGAPLEPAEQGLTWMRIAEGTALRKRLGHYLGATFYYAGEWYWGIDRLHHLERRLQQLAALTHGFGDVMFAPAKDLRSEQLLANPPPIDFFFSLRSPFSAIAAPRVFQLGRLTGAEIRLRYVLPMVMRGLPVPREKRIAISLDAAREARLQDIPFGRVNDPVGRPTERGLALMPFAERAGKGREYVLSFLRGVWAEGIDAGSQRGLRRIVERAGLPWDEARTALKDKGWRAIADDNRAELFSRGLWGVPSFHVGDIEVWGQDRLWVVEQALLGTAPAWRDSDAVEARA